METVAIASGKGGTGKTFFSAVLAQILSLPPYNFKVLLADLDFQGPNLHHYLSSQNYFSLSHYLKEGMSLKSCIEETSFPNLKFLKAGESYQEPSPLKFYERQKLIKVFSSLEGYDFLILDLPSGSDFNVLDFLLWVRKKILVTNLDSLALENLFYLLKKLLLRSLKDFLKDFDPKVKEEIENSLKEFCKDRRGFSEIINFLATFSLEIEEKVLEHFSSLEIFLVFNRLRGQERGEGKKFFSQMKFSLSYLNLRLLGEIFSDLNLILKKEKRISPSFLTPSVYFCFQEIAEKLVKG